MNKSENINWLQFYKSIFSLVLPMALQNLINVGVTAADVIMLGRVGEKVLSGASLAGQIQFVMMLFFFGITAGATVLTAQYWGKRDKKAIEKILGIALVFGIATAVLFTIVALLIPELLMQIFTSDAQVIKEGVKYLRIVAFSYLFMGITQVYLNILRSIERVVISTVVYFVSLVVNVMINAFLIFGLLGFPCMGIRGAAIGTLGARITETVIVVFYAIYKNTDIKFRISHMLHMDRELLRDFIYYSMPVVINEIMWGIGCSANTAIIGHLGSAAVAANSVAQVARQLAMVVAFGIANATAIWIGKTLGERKTEEAKEYAKRFMMISLLLGAAGGLLILLVGPLTIRFLSLSVVSQKYLRIMFFVMSYFCVGQAFNSTMVCGIFRSGGDTRFGLVLDVSTMWGGSIFFGGIAAFLFHASVPIVYIILMSDEIIKMPICLWRYRKYLWLNNVTRES